MCKQCNSSSFTVAGKAIGKTETPFIIAEIAQAHDGSLGIAHSYIEAVGNAGADAIKFQTHIADAESTLEERFRTPFSYEDTSRFEYWKRMEFTSEQWSELAKHAEEKGEGRFRRLAEGQGHEESQSRQAR